MRLMVSSAKWRPFSLGRDDLITRFVVISLALCRSCNHSNVSVAIMLDMYMYRHYVTPP